MDGPLRLLAVRDDPPATTTDPAAELLKLLQDPFSGQVRRPYLHSDQTSHPT